MITVRIISVGLLFLYVPDAISANVIPPGNPLAKRILLSILIGLAIQLLIIIAIPGAVILFILDHSLKAGGPDDWRLLMVNMLLYASFSFLILTAFKKSVD
jgi:hypothetical protein